MGVHLSGGHFTNVVKGSQTRICSLKSSLILNIDPEYLETVNTTMHQTLSTVCHGNSVLANTAMDICGFFNRLI